ncbi:SMP-30/gluconolactonase/LRE family protein [Pseudoalteromonas sp. MMG010]|uniref:SMP-30/gluconolactonase/LRE family protein n=1 Tax=Pseudoalteromonas sp. MMG010 TaxID=2822685 RepID=UPI001B3A34E3|nr:SMP-30/gluconolactonase/LRE family protein [Pseudoalteromonas sp. MMG010]MBQ4834049.1 SMP-30/gluconolactonase/LRE family protein [Pseudoalteromonas sp. MMG010]
MHIQSDDITHTISSCCLLGEGAYYWQVKNSLLWVDILGKALFCYSLENNKTSRYDMVEPICWVMETTKGQLIAGFEKAIYQLDTNTFERTLLFSLLNEPPENRLNDAKTDRNGFAYFGTMDKAEKKQQGALYRFGHGQAPTKVDDNYMISNGPAVSRCGKWLYSTDSAQRTVYRFSVDQLGQLTNKHIFITFSEDMGFPDGMTVDEEDCLWIAAWGGFGVYRFSAAGEKLQHIAVPVPQVTCVAFIGKWREQLAITTARVGLSKKQQQKYPQSGNVFIIKPGVRGLCETPVEI